MRIAVINGPNLNLLGEREPEIYGTATLNEIEASVRERARSAGAEIDWMQSNHEGELVEAVQRCASDTSGILVNGAAFTHTSIALRDALLAVRIPFVEIHLSNIFAREEVRRSSLLADAAVGVICGFGPLSYALGLDALLDHLDS